LGHAVDCFKFHLIITLFIIFFRLFVYFKVSFCKRLVTVSKLYLCNHDYDSGCALVTTSLVSTVTHSRSGRSICCRGSVTAEQPVYTADLRASVVQTRSHLKSIQSLLRMDSLTTQTKQQYRPSLCQYNSNRNKQEHTAPQHGVWG